MWGGFRVARRARPKLLSKKANDAAVTLQFSHNGYTRLKPKVIHERSFTANNDSFEVTDTLKGDWQQAEACFFLHPSVSVDVQDSGELKLSLPDQSVVMMSFDSGDVKVLPSQWYPEFGVSQDNTQIKVSFTAATLTTKIVLRN